MVALIIIAVVVIGSLFALALCRAAAEMDRAFDDLDREIAARKERQP